jgi:hypothetical protein
MPMLVFDALRGQNKNNILALLKVQRVWCATKTGARIITTAHDMSTVHVYS